MKKGSFIVISGPSGVGKNTLADILVDMGYGIYSVSMTTRKIRDGEVEAKDYFFVDNEEFEDNIKNDNKIWENDIVTEDWRNEKGIVRFGEFEAQVLKNIGFNIEWNYISYRQDICYWVGKCEVIGNVFDNPELLEGGNE